MGLYASLSREEPGYINQSAVYTAEGHALLTRGRADNKLVALSTFNKVI
jgi:hypothetical protein